MEETKLSSTVVEPALPFDGSIILTSNEYTEKKTPVPVSKSERIQTIDIVRGFALLGILLMNIPGFGIDRSVFWNIINGPTNNRDYYALAGMATFFEGTMRGLFSMLFGAAMILFTLNKRETPGGLTVAEAYYRRLMWLVLFGMINAYILLWQGDILFYYGLIGMLLYPLRKSSPKWLLMLGILCFVIGVYKGMSGYLDMREKRAKYLTAVTAEKQKKTLTAEQKTDKEAWIEIEKNSKPDPENKIRHVNKMRSDYGTIFTYFIPGNSNGEAWGTYHAIWDMLGMMLIGMGLFTIGFFSNRLPTSTYAMTLLIGYGIGIPISWIFFSKGWVGSNNIAQYVDAYRVPHWVLYDLRRLLLAVGHAAAIMLVFRSKVIPWLMNGLGNVGQMAFTNYLMQSIICTLFFYGYGFGNYDKLRFYELYFVVGTVWIFQLIFSSIWLRYFRFGPFEWLWRSLTYWKLQPMRIKPKTVTVSPLV